MSDARRIERLAAETTTAGQRTAHLAELLPRRACETRRDLVHTVTFSRRAGVKIDRRADTAYGTTTSAPVSSAPRSPKGKVEAQRVEQRPHITRAEAETRRRRIMTRRPGGARPDPSVAPWSRGKNDVGQISRRSPDAGGSDVVHRAALIAIQANVVHLGGRRASKGSWVTRALLASRAEPDALGGRRGEIGRYALPDLRYQQTDDRPERALHAEPTASRPLHRMTGARRDAIRASIELRVGQVLVSKESAMRSGVRAACSAKAV